MLIYRQPISIVISIISILLLTQCASMLPVAINDSLSEAMLINAKPVDYQIRHVFKSELSDEHLTKFNPGMGDYQYNINFQVNSMYEEFINYKSNDISENVLFMSVFLNDFKTNYEEIGGTGAVLGGTNDIRRTAEIHITLKIVYNKKTIMNQKFKTKKSILARGSKKKYNTWMEIYSDAINDAINKSIIKTDKLIDVAISKI